MVTEIPIVVVPTERSPKDRKLGLVDIMGLFGTTYYYRVTGPEYSPEYFSKYFCENI